MYAFYELSPVERERKIAVRAELLLFAWYQRIRSVQHETAGRIAIAARFFQAKPCIFRAVGAPLTSNFLGAGIPP
jgi:hypothetical protein